MHIEDDRTEQQMQTHRIIIAATDKFLSGWGMAEGGKSYAGWACRYEHYQKVYDWVRNRSDMKRARIVGNDWRPRGAGHTHIYVVEEGHPALTGRARRHVILKPRRPNDFGLPSWLYREKTDD